MIFVEGDGYLATRNHGAPAVYYDAVGDIAAACLGPYASESEAQADLDSRRSMKKQVPVPAQIVKKPEGWYVINPVWGCSLSQWQIRVLDDPTSGNAADRWRVAEKLRADPVYATQAARVISKNWTDFTPWSAYKSENYKEFMDKDFVLISGHPQAANWNK